MTIKSGSIKQIGGEPFVATWEADGLYFHGATKSYGPCAGDLDPQFREFVPEDFPALESFASKVVEGLGAVGFAFILLKVYTLWAVVL